MNVNSVLQQVDELYARSEGVKAERLMCSAIEEAVKEQDNEGLLQLLNELLGYYRETSQVEQSYQIAEQIIALALGMGLENTIPYATCLLNVANAYRAGGRLADSLECYEKVRAIYSVTLAKDNMLIASMENNLSLLYQEMGEFDKAKESLLRALPIVLGKKADFEVAVTYANLAGTCMQLGEGKEAYRYAQLAVNGFEAMNVQDAHYGAALAALGMYYYGLEEYSRALECFTKARDIMEQNLGKNEYYYRLESNVQECRDRLAETAVGTEAGLDL
jgi:tetratricopeptide (TPR) repeat protein